MSDPDVPHYFNAQPRVPSQRRLIRVQLPDLSFDMETDAGVFSHGRLDAGTKILLLEAPTLPEQGRLLDLGCGAGPLALTMAQRRPQAEVIAVDINERARHLVTDNARRLGLSNISVLEPDNVLALDTSHEEGNSGGAGATDTFDVIWSNPPIKVGKAALHQMMTTWLPRLAPQGIAVLVVHKNLGSDSLATWLSNQGWTVRRLASRQGYRILAITR